MRRKFRRSARKATVAAAPGGYVVRCIDAAGVPAENTFETKREAKRFARRVNRLPDEGNFDRAKIERLNAEYTGSFLRNAGQEAGILPPK